MVKVLIFVFVDGYQQLKSNRSIAHELESISNLPRKNYNAWFRPLIVRSMQCVHRNVIGWVPAWFAKVFGFMSIRVSMAGSAVMCTCVNWFWLMNDHSLLRFVVRFFAHRVCFFFFSVVPAFHVDFHGIFVQDGAPMSSYGWRGDWDFKIGRQDAFAALTSTQTSTFMKHHATW